jgi:WXXGXW repeat (2 copies)
MKITIVDRGRNGTKTKRKWPMLLLFLLVSVAFGISGCDEYYGGYPGYGPYYGGNRPYGPGYPGYGRYAGSVTVEIGDRPYYTRGPGYYVGRAYYVWRPGHWAWRRGQRVWVHGHYVVRG